LRDYQAASAHAAAVLAVAADHAEARGIQDQARAALERFDDAVSQARQQIAAGDAPGAARSIETARAIDPASTAVTDLAVRLSESIRSREAAARDSASRQSPPAPAPRSTPERAPSKGATPPPAVTAVPPPAVETSPPAPQPPAAPVPQPSPDPTTAAPTPAPKPDPPPPPAPAAPPPSTTAKPVPPPEQPPAGPSQDELDDAAIRRTVAAYGRAIENKDVALFRSIKPNMSADEERRLQQGFRAVSSQRVSLTVASIDRRGDTASVVVQRRDELDTGGRRQTVQARQVLSLSKARDGWVITAIR
jgi:outer membrane biosynthesis protein TonB